MQDDAQGTDDLPPGILDAGAGRGRAHAERTCLVTRQAGSPERMIRFALGPDGQVVPDLRARLPGRGAWVTATRAAVAEAVRKRLFQRAFRQKGAVTAAPDLAQKGVLVAPDLADVIEAGLREDLRQAFSLANKAGCVVTGFTKVESAVESPAGIAALVHASDASPDGRRKLAQALRRRYGDAISRIPVLDDLSGEELDMALGRDHVIHAALVAGAGTAGLLARWRRLHVFRGEAATPGTAGTEPTGPDAALPGAVQDG
ncbi:RNA-binding protein [Methylobacterium nonmethylotrophicum]|uniref:RNA-binding protein n=1 Tax=Methylobacterium nonmethylotrophicum TaxID=1141884 RepID=A0A4Z0NQG3_9HYPH|nr:RNA-binding protein [Methylobacterium nonmethylotrophicum]TGD98289.1 RNA-binding protein [Methylobacterium nonmethylotrophicum]